MFPKVAVNDSVHYTSRVHGKTCGVVDSILPTGITVQTIYGMDYAPLHRISHINGNPTGGEPVAEHKDKGPRYNWDWTQVVTDTVHALAAASAQVRVNFNELVLFEGRLKPVDRGEGFVVTTMAKDDTVITGYFVREEVVMVSVELSPSLGFIAYIVVASHSRRSDEYHSAE
jgi:hypothetical protein